MMKHTLQMDRLIDMDRDFFEGVQWSDEPLARKDVGQKLAEIAKAVETFCKQLGDPDDPIYLVLDDHWIEYARNVKEMLLCGLQAQCQLGGLFAELPRDWVDDDTLSKVLIAIASHVRWCFRVLEARQSFPPELRDFPAEVIRAVRQYEIYVSKNKGL